MWLVCGFKYKDTRKKDPDFMETAHVCATPVRTAEKAASFAPFARVKHFRVDIASPKALRTHILWLLGPKAKAM